MKYIILLFFVNFLIVSSIAQNTFFMGTALTGGSDDEGTLFRTDSVGMNLTVTHNFTKIEGSIPWGNLCEATNGKLYGTTEYGGLYSRGVIFEYDPIADTYVIVFNFGGVANDGWYPRAALIQANNGKLYGLTSDRGVYGDGVLFEYDLTTNTYTKKLDLDNINTGKNPHGRLLEVANNKLYALMLRGGMNNDGTLLEYDLTTNTYAKKVDFDNFVTGKLPIGSLMEASNGKLYGGCSEGGMNARGTLFEYDLTANALTILVHLGGISGERYIGELLEVSTGKLYGTTSMGSGSDGILFEYDFLLDTYMIKAPFYATTSGSEPTGRLLLASNGNIYGQTRLGGSSGYGTLWEYTMGSSTVISLVDYEGINNGGSPKGGVIEASNGKLYGTTARNLFEYDFNTLVHTKKLDFQNSFDGQNPIGALMQASNGLLYGVTNQGGFYHGGTLFEYNPVSHIHTKLFDFSDSLGRNPEAKVIEGNNGKLYGMTVQGGANNKGVLFEYDLGTMTYNKLFDFSTIDGITPKGSLLQLANGKMYGMTVFGGINNNGVLFEYDPATNVYTKKVDFDNVVTGNYPLGNLVLAANNALYGLTSSGGINNDGVLFEYNPITDVYTKKIDFNETITGELPNGSLLLAGNNAFYGMTSLGGANNRGVLFEYEPITNTYTKKIDFDGANNGAKPKGSLIQASSGLLYGTTPEGGSNNDGVLFEYNFLTDTYVKKLDLDRTITGPYTRLMEVNSLPLRINTVSVEKSLRVYPNPTTGRMTIDFGKKYATTQVKITNIIGQLIWKDTVSNQQLLELQLEAIAGIYIIEVHSEEGIFVERIIKN